MTLVDTSVWVEHFRKGEPALARLLLEGQVLMHPFVLGELACGTLRDRSILLKDLATLPKPALATHEEVLRMVAAHAVWGQGIGWIDAHLLASKLLANCGLWSLDRRLNRIAAAMGLLRPPRNAVVTSNAPRS